MRIAVGHGLIRIGMWIHAISTGLAALCTVAIIVVVISALFGVSDFPTVFGDPGERVGVWTYAWQAALMIVGLLIVGRILISGVFAWAGWHLLPHEHRDVLNELDERVAARLDR